jgi:hypothetical protein
MDFFIKLPNVDKKKIRSIATRIVREGKQCSQALELFKAHT